MKMTEPIDRSGVALRGSLRLNEPMAKHVSWRAGGAAERAYVPADRADLAAFLATLPRGERVCFVGLGSNLLVRDGGFHGTVILMHSPHGVIRVEGGLIYAEASAACPKVARLTATSGFEGAEFLAGVPGTVGGALAMNAGCYGSETWDVVAKVLTVSRAGKLRERSPGDFEVRYRRRTSFSLQPGSVSVTATAVAPAWRSRIFCRAASPASRSMNPTRARYSATRPAL